MLNPSHFSPKLICLALVPQVLSSQQRRLFASGADDVMDLCCEENKLWMAKGLSSTPNNYPPSAEMTHVLLYVFVAGPL